MRKILIANRGEIAVRVVRACREWGYESVAVYADQDISALHVRLADEAYGLGGTTAAETYLHHESLLAAARASGADALHPGYGFLSESAEFARAVIAAGLTWIGPSPDSIDALGDKVTARQIAQRVGAPLVPGLDRPLVDAAEAVTFADEHGLPIVIKAAFGGGGRGLKIVREIDEVAEAFESATREAIAAFGRGECFVERFLEQPRHVEVQVLGDGRGSVVVVGDRDCSVQRRNQKLIEEAPAPGLTAEQRSRLHTAARDICSEVNYAGAGTVEFLLGRDGTLTFLEVNTRLQVEHPVTEAVTGVDLVREQFLIAEGRGPSFTETPVPQGHSMEFRINAEDPGRGFLPSPGRITKLTVPGGMGIRWDAGVVVGDTVQPAFDSMMAKLIVHSSDRALVVRRAQRALAELEIEGPATVIPFAQLVLADQEFSGDSFAVSTQWVESVLLPRLEMQARPEPVADPALSRVDLEIDGRIVTVGFPPGMLAGFVGMSTGEGATAAAASAAESEANAVRATAPGVVVDWVVDDGAPVRAGDDLVVLDAMKMETRVTAHRDGVLRQRVATGAMVAADEILGMIDD